MVKKWQKNLLEAIQNIPNINFEIIFQDIAQRNFTNYDIKKLSGYSDLYRLRIGGYRIVFYDDTISEVKIVTFDKRGQIYKGLKNYRK